jgi:hypothetical protein
MSDVLHFFLILVQIHWTSVRRRSDVPHFFSTFSSNSLDVCQTSTSDVHVRRPSVFSTFCSNSLVVRQFDVLGLRDVLGLHDVLGLREREEEEDEKEAEKEGVHRRLHPRTSTDITNWKKICRF